MSGLIVRKDPKPPQASDKRTNVMRDRMANELKEIRHSSGKVMRASPEDFGKKTSPVRERMAKELKEMPPEERISPSAQG